MIIHKINTLHFFLAFIFVLCFASCSKKSSSSNISRGTGWNVGTKKQVKEQAPGPGLIFVEGGAFTMGRVEDDVMHDWNNTPTKMHVQSFFMDETEVTNAMYGEYTAWIKKVFATETNFKDIYEGVVPDTLVWRDRVGFNETMTRN
jgi:gliding motility-associated lipoprotein GldJ